MTDTGVPLRRPPGRYDERRRLPQGARVALVALLAGAVLAGLVVAWRSFESRTTRATLLSYRVVSDRSVEVRFQVDRPVGGSVRCTRTARARDGAEVGRETFRVGPQRTSPVRVTHVLSTRARAAAADVAGCSS